jgi:hypothetical protein
MVVSLKAMNQKELALAIDHTVRQSVRTQKIVKEALLIKMGIESKKNAKQMQFSIDMLNMDLNGFLGKSRSKLPVIKDKKILLKLLEFKKAWREFEKRATAVANLQYTPNDINYLADNNIELLLKSRAVVLSVIERYKESSNLKFANDIKIAGNQRMLLQMISKDILMYLNNLHKTDSLRDLKKIKDINRNFSALLNGDAKLKCIGVKLPKIVNRIKEAQNSWQEAKPLISKALKRKDKNVVKSIMLKLDNIRVNMRQAVVLYRKSLNREKQYMAINSIVGNFYKKLTKIKQLIDLAGKQRMLTQRMAKLAIECSYNLTKNSCQKLQSDKKLYSNVLKLFELAKQKKTLEPELFNLVKDEISIIKTDWEPFSKDISIIVKSNAKNNETLNRVLQKNEKLLKLSNDLVVQMLRYYKNRLTPVEQKSLRIINIAGKERMLSQKMSKEFLENSILKNSNSYAKLTKTIKLYSLILNSLLDGNNKLSIPKVTNYEIKKQLKKVATLWAKLKPIYLKNRPNTKELKLILLANPMLLKEMDKTVKLITKATEY